MAESSVTHAAEIERGERFEFGANWSRFLRVLNEERIAAAEQSLRGMLEVETLVGRRFLDIGCGSGLFSLAARRLGATVHSFDYDPRSVACAMELRRRYFDGDQSWTIAEGSVLDADYVSSLGEFDVVYSWGVLHHTGAMWKALDNAATPLKVGGQLFVAIYNTQPGWTPFYTRIKRLYVESPAVGKWFIAGTYIGVTTLRQFLSDVRHGRNPFAVYKEYQTRARGMSVWYDLIDWLGGYPFETARPEEIFDFYRRRGFALQRLTTDAGLGCNQFVFRRHAESGNAAPIGGEGQLS
jgi:2-polyprenyl-6-hydroxyphenyl methylase/3-demethylubiquinone-9 3-methyltransferase